MIQTGRDATYPCHDGAKQEKQALPMSLHIGLGQLDTNCENTDGENDSGNFEGDGIGSLMLSSTPPSGIEDVRAIRP